MRNYYPLLLLLALPAGAEDKRPNILIAIADDQSYPYTSYYGLPGISTPGFDFVASSGVAFSNAYVSSPGSSPSRASILTGKYPWQTAEAGTHASSFPAEYICLPDIMEAEGYRTGFTGKGWAPGNWQISGRKRNPAGPAFNEKRSTPPHKGISNVDYAANFEAFLESSDSSKPFYFWYGANEPHRPYSADSWKKEGRNPEDAPVPPFLPRVDAVEADIANHIIEIEWFDSHLQKIIGILRDKGMLENTLIIVTADNGMPFPHAKANCYESGIHVPFAVCWGERIRHREIENTIVSTVDIFPTVLDAARIRKDKYSPSGYSLAPLLGFTGGKYRREATFSGRERHSSSRYRNMGYPVRTIRKGDYILIHNFHPERWPAGNPLLKDGIDLHKGFRDIDDSPSKSFLIEHGYENGYAAYYSAAVAKRPEFELFNIREDPQCMSNLAGKEEYRKVFESMKSELENFLIATGDSRYGDNPEVWESYPRLVGADYEFCED